MPSIRDLYWEVGEKLGRLDFGRLWEGFKRYDFALYDSDSVCFGGAALPRDDRFMGNTAILYEGRHTAIWGVESPYPGGDDWDADLLAANLVHEMFHAFQAEHGETRYPRDLLALTYPFDARNYRLKYEENLLLSEAFFEKEIGRKIELLNDICGLRAKRAEIIGGMLDCELLAETAEGMAEYVGCLALKELSAEKFGRRAASHADILKTPNKTQFDIRRVSYFSGALLLLTAIDAGLSPNHSVGCEKRTVFEIIASQLKPSLPIIAEDDRISELAEEVFKERGAAIEAFFADRPQRNEGSFFIGGYDPMNMFRRGDFIMCGRFIRLIDAETQKSITLMGRTLLEMEAGSLDRAAAYYRQRTALN